MNASDTRRALALVEKQGKTHEEAARALGTSKDAVSAALFRHRNPGYFERYYMKRQAGVVQDHRPLKIVCLASGCLKDAEGGKFCEAHSFKPRTDQPMYRLMGAR